MKTQVHTSHLPIIGYVLICLAGILFNWWLIEIADRSTKEGCDFAQFYAAGKLVGTGHLYDVAAIKDLERPNTKTLGLTARLPAVALLYKAFSVLPYKQAQLFWFILNVAAGFAACWLWPHVNRWSIAIAFCWSVPAAITLFFGQDDLLLLFFLALGLYLISKDRPQVAGVVFALGLCKFHLLLGLAVMLMAQRRWRVIASGCLSVCLLLALSFVLEGPHWAGSYVSVARLSEFSIAEEKMPDLFGLTHRITPSLPFEMACSLLLAAILWYVCRNRLVGITGCFAVASGLLMAHHAYGYDCVLLLPLAAWTVTPGVAPRWLRLPGLALLSPTFCPVLASDRSLIAQAAVVGFVTASLLWNLFTETRDGVANERPSADLVAA